MKKVKTYTKNGEPLTSMFEVLNCSECKKPLPNKILSLDGKAWHGECFTEEIREEVLKKFPDYFIKDTNF